MSMVINKQKWLSEMVTKRNERFSLLHSSPPDISHFYTSNPMSVGYLYPKILTLPPLKQLCPKVITYKQHNGANGHMLWSVGHVTMVPRSPCVMDNPSTVQETAVDGVKHAWQ